MKLGQAGTQVGMQNHPSGEQGLGAFSGEWWTGKQWVPTSEGLPRTGAHGGGVWASSVLLKSVSSSLKWAALLEEMDRENGLQVRGNIGFSGCV